MTMHPCARTDLALESRTEGEDPPQGVRFSEEKKEGATVVRIDVENGAGEKATGKPAGRYVTLSFGDPLDMEEAERERLAEAFGGELRDMLGRKGVKVGRGRTVLVAGLGNRRLASDAVGPAVVSKITVTRHLERLDRALFEKLGQSSVAALAPGVLGDTGMESAETLLAVSNALRPSALVVVDALAARGVERLASTIQLCDSGIAPGGGVGNDRPALGEKEFGVPVIAAGVPTVVDVSTLTLECLSEAGVVFEDEKSLPERLREALENGRRFFVSPKEIDAQVEALSEIVARGIDLALRLEPDGESQSSL